MIRNYDNISNQFTGNLKINSDSNATLLTNPLLTINEQN